jgi:uncharacterized protein with von Willebrand factor type A (vWA) domain
MGQISFDQVDIFQILLAQLLCKSREQQLVFPELFDQFWQELFRSFDARLKPSAKKPTDDKKAGAPSLIELKNWLYNKPTAHTEKTAFYSRGVSATNQDLSKYQSEHIEELVRIITEIAKKWASQTSRRRVISKSKGQIDLRQLVRRNLSTGEMINLSFRENKIQKPRLVLVCDVSKSMEVFSNFTVQLMYAFQNSYRSIETFVFGTELYHVTKSLKYQSFNRALNKLSEEVPDWSGGTRIGYCLDRFIKNYGLRLLHGKVIFLIISDGWDTGEPELLESSMKFIKRRVKKLIWLNPQAGKPNFEPQVKGMITALPYIDYMHAVHDIESLRKLRS